MKFHMLRASQISIANVLAVVAVVAALMAGSAIATLFVCEAIAVYAFVRLLTRRLPSAIRGVMDANCERMDGSWSARREVIERDAQRRFFYKVLFPVLFVVVPSNVFLLFVNAELFPVSVGISAMSSFRSSPAKWKANLHEEETDFEQWGKRKNLSRATIETRKRAIWSALPLFLSCGLVWGMLCFVFFNGTYERALSDLATAAELRAEDYTVHDLMTSERQAD